MKINGSHLFVCIARFHGGLKMQLKEGEGMTQLRAPVSSMFSLVHFIESMPKKVQSIRLLLQNTLTLFLSHFINLSTA